MKILVTGDRNWLITPESQRLLEETEYEPTLERRLEIAEEIDKIQKSRIDFIWKVLDTYTINAVTPTIIEGGARGVDTIARNWAIDRGAPLKEYPADWSNLGKKAGPIRNIKMLDTEHPDLVIAFHPDLSQSKGTNHMVNYANKKGVEVHSYNGKERV